MKKYEPTKQQNPSYNIRVPHVYDDLLSSSSWKPYRVNYRSASSMLFILCCDWRADRTKEMMRLSGELMQGGKGIASAINSVLAARAAVGVGSRYR